MTQRKPSLSLLVLVDGSVLDVTNPDAPSLQSPQFLVAGTYDRPSLRVASPCGPSVGR